jgi:predicted nucleic acid-binding protein
MAGFLLDTNVVSELVRPRPAERVVAWVVGQAPADLYLAALTIGELTRGVERLPGGRRRDTLVRWIDRDLSRQFAGRILPFDREAAVLWGRIMGEGDRNGRPRAAADAQIAATARRHGLALATRNTADFEGMGVDLVDPWAG